MGYGLDRPVAAIGPSIVTAGAENTWLHPGRSPLLPQRRYGAAEVDVVLQRVVATLLRELRNREGDLHLTAVASVIAGLPDPDAAWHAILTFILERPEVRGTIRTVTHRTMYATGRPAETAVDQVPPAVVHRLGVYTDGGGHWRLAEFTSPVPDPTASQGPGAPSGWGGSGGNGSWDVVGQSSATWSTAGGATLGAPVAGYTPDGHPLPPGWHAGRQT